MQAAPHHGPIEHAVMETIKYSSYAVAGFALLPVLLPWLGIGGRASEIAAGFCTKAASEGQTGWAGAIAGALSHIPVLGAGLATAGIPSVAIAAAVGIGGVLLARHLEKKGTQFYGLPAGRIVRWLALGTSVLFALPAILSGITMSLHFLATMFNSPGSMTNVMFMPLDSWQTRFADNFFYQEGANKGIAAALTGMANIVGTVTTASAGSGALGSVITALVCCAPAGLVAWMAGDGNAKLHAKQAGGNPRTTIYGPAYERIRAMANIPSAKPIRPDTAPAASDEKRKGFVSTHAATSTLPLPHPAL
jgi:hypothetical protein